MAWLSLTSLISQDSVEPVYFAVNKALLEFRKDMFASWRGRGLKFTSYFLKAVF